jgi:hypothetical protein
MLKGTYYYAWYTMNWLPRTQRRTDPPTLGHYNNSSYGTVVREHFRKMKRHGVDFVAVSFDPRMPQYEHVMYASEEFEVPLTVLYESLSRATGQYQSVTTEDLPAILADMRNLSQDLSDESWLRIDGKPVVMIYVSRNYSDASSAFPRIREALGGDVFLVGDEVFWDNGMTPERAGLFDAVTSYNWYQPGRFSGKGRKACDSFLTNVRKEVKKNISTCDKAGVPYWAVAMPGYDDRRVRPQARHEPIPREDGYLFERSLKDAKAGNQAIMVTSFNEWFEDTQVEPTASYGDAYLKMIRDL